MPTDNNESSKASNDGAAADRPLRLVANEVEPKECPGHVGRGNGPVCVLCHLPIPDLWRRGANSPSEMRADCTDCRNGRTHTHGGTA